MSEPLTSSQIPNTMANYPTRFLLYLRGMHTRVDGRSLQAFNTLTKEIVDEILYLDLVPTTREARIAG